MATTYQPLARGIQRFSSASQSAQAGSKWILPLFFVVVALPAELNLKIFEATLSPVRLFLLFVLGPAIIKLATDRTAKLLAFDYLLFFYMLWLWLAILVNHPFPKGLYFGGSLTLEALGGYVIARAYVRTYQDLVRAASAYFMAIAVLAVLAIAESLSGRALVHEITFRLVGEEMPEWITSYYRDIRFGLFRAFVTYDHPIQYGTFCAGCFALAYFLYHDHAQKWQRLFIICVAVFFSLSSGPFLMLGLAMALCLWEKLTRPIPRRVLITVCGVLFLWLLISIASNRGLLEIFIASTLDPRSGYYRLYIWEYGSAAIVENPLFGLSLDKWPKAHFMSASIDNFWVVMGMLGGMPAVGALLLCVILALRRVNRRGIAPELFSRSCARYGWSITLIIFCVEGLTVHYWFQLYVLFFFVIGLGGCLADTQWGYAAPAERERMSGQDATSWASRRPARRLVERGDRLVHPLKVGH